ncbi:MAG: hypothetical protein ACTSRS_11910 [Candidatus Helarchaeota archaeon]
MSLYTKNHCKGSLEDALTFSEIEILKEIIEVTKSLCKKTCGKLPAFLLIGMRALYYYFGRAAFNPALISVEIDLNFDILMNWAPFRHKIPNLIKTHLESLGYHVNPGIGLISILKEGLLIHLTVIFEHKDQIIGSFIPALQISAANKDFLLYSKLSRGDPVKDLSRLKCLFQNCPQHLNLDRILAFAYEAERPLIKQRITELIKNRI